MQMYWSFPITMAEKPFAESAASNAAPILEILQHEFRDRSRVLEIGSGTGQHAVAFAKVLRHLYWQTSDLDENHAGIRAWADDAQLGNLGAPLSLDVRTANIDEHAYDAAYSANTAHIMSIDAVEKMFTLLGKVLCDGGVFCLYGPFQRNGEFNARSNANFDAGLRQRDPAMGIRDIECLDEFASAAGMHRQRLYAVPSNNNVAVWRRGGS
jgi:cyclopropane fatty-acyl-phospholipid synthase-like methyltransferase